MTPVRAIVLLLACAAAATAARAQDDTPPVFVQTTLTFYRVPDGREVGSVVVPPAGLTVPGVARDRRFVVTTTAGDPESGVSTLRAAIDARWSCTSVLTSAATAMNPVLDGRSDEEKGGTAAPGSPRLRAAHFSVDALGGSPTRLVCPATSDASALTVTVRPTAANAQGRGMDSGPAVVVYAPRPHTGLPAGAVCGNNATGQTAVCTTGANCDFRRQKVCSGWFVFSRCDYKKSVDMFCD